MVFREKIVVAVIKLLRFSLLNSYLWVGRKDQGILLLYCLWINFVSALKYFSHWKQWVKLKILMRYTDKHFVLFGSRTYSIRVQVMRKPITAGIYLKMTL